VLLWVIDLLSLKSIIIVFLFFFTLNDKKVWQPQSRNQDTYDSVMFGNTKWFKVPVLITNPFSIFVFIRKKHDCKEMKVSIKLQLNYLKDNFRSRSHYVYWHGANLVTKLFEAKRFENIDAISVFCRWK
jgi:hypothetical protein